jgi:hypothetical protein
MNSQGVFNSRSLRASISEDHHNNGYLEGLGISRKVVIGAILVVALIAFELFNFDTTRYALQYLLGEVQFWGLRWATILAIAFCAIDFAGLARLFTPEQGKDEPKTVWYLMGAWLLGATMNAVMTWWAVSLTLLSHDFGNEVLSREQLLEFVPVFVAALVWLTRILFIGALSVAGDHLFTTEESDDTAPRALTGRPVSAPLARTPTPRPRMAQGANASSRAQTRHVEPPVTSRPLQTRGQRFYQRQTPGTKSRSSRNFQARRGSR